MGELVVLRSSSAFEARKIFALSMFQIRKYQASKRIPISTITVSDHFLIIKVVKEKKLTYPYK